MSADTAPPPPAPPAQTEDELREMQAQIARANVLRHSQIIAESLVALRLEGDLLKPRKGDTPRSNLAQVSAITTNVLLLGKAMIDNQAVSARVFSGKPLTAKPIAKYVIERIPIPPRAPQAQVGQALAGDAPTGAPPARADGAEAYGPVASNETESAAPAGNGAAQGTAREATSAPAIPDAATVARAVLEDDGLPAITPSEVLPPDVGAGAITKSAIMLALERQRKAGS